MWIKQLRVQNCRSIKDSILQFSPNLNIIVGDNASGKTSLLESLSLLSNGRSFRTSHISDVITRNEKQVLIAAKIVDNNVTSHIGIEKSATKARIRIDQQDIYSQAELSRYLPITVIHPDSLRLITGAPSFRRSYVDWIAFYLFPDFHEKWKSYQHILKQRNQCLKNSKHQNSLEKWTEELVALQPDIIHYRKAALKKLEPFLVSTSSKLLKGIDVEIAFDSGLPEGLVLNKDSLMSFYQNKLKYDSFIQRTSAGVHKANLKFLMGSNLAEKVASRGQLKLLSIALLLSQNIAINNDKDRRGILLVDDFTSELDSANNISLINYLLELDQQIIITSTQSKVINEISKRKVFHVKHGVINELEET